MKIFFVFFAFFFKQVCFGQDLLSLFNNNAAVFYGEIHNVQEHHLPLMESLEKGIETGLIDTFATEYVEGKLQEAFQQYLNSPFAIKDSALERSFFKSVGSWADSERNRAFYRKMRDLKRKHGTRINFCGIDYDLPTDIGNLNDNSPIKRRFITLVYIDLPGPILKKVLETSNMTLDDLVANGMEYYREATMAANLTKCASDSKKLLVHAGAYHVHKESAPLNDWWTLSRLFGAVTNNKYSTVINAITFQGTDGDSLSQAFYDIQMKYKFSKSTFISATKLPLGIVELLRIKEIDEYLEANKFWDYFILGPFGTKLSDEYYPSPY